MHVGQEVPPSYEVHERHLRHSLEVYPAITSKPERPCLLAN